MFKVIEYYGDAKKQKMLIRVVREKLIRELRFNLALLSDANRIFHRKAQPLSIEQRFNLVQHLSTTSFDVVVELGIPLDEVCTGILRWQEGESQYRQRVVKDEANSDLLERTYHNLRMQKIHAEERVEKRAESLHYSIWLCQSTLCRLRNEEP